MATTSRDLDLRFGPARSVADAVCYEGYVLYPYRASAAKNQFRWQFGVLVPRSMASTASEPSSARAEIVVEVRPGAQLHLRVRGLHVQQREVREVRDGGLVPVARYDEGDESWTSFDEAVEWQEDLCDVAIDFDGDEPVSRVRRMALAAAESDEAVGGAEKAGARVARRRQPVGARVEVDVSPVDGPMGLVRVGLTLANDTDWSRPGASRDEVLRRSLVAAHLLVGFDRAEPLSSLDPPPRAAEAVAGCTNVGLFPVLVGRGVVLASPIVLYDHPAVAPESHGDMYDATEIDEILALRVRTLTDDEKREARGTDRRAAAVVDRCDAMDATALDGLHGTFRPVEAPGLREQAGGGSGTPWWDPDVDATFDPWTDTVDVAGVTVANGTRVRLRPSHRADAQDLFVDGRTATVAGVFHDVAGGTYLAVVVDDPDADLHAWHGRYLFFAPDEVEVLDGGAPAPLPASDGTRPRVLVAGVGNIFLGDDGFGVEVVREMLGGDQPPSVKIADFGIRGVHLAYELLDGYDVLVLVDAVSIGDPPGTVTLIEHASGTDATADATADATFDDGGGMDIGGGTLAAMDAHGMNPAAVLAMAGDLGARVGRVLVLGCEVAQVAEGMGLSAPVAAAVPAARRALGDLVASLAGAEDPLTVTVSTPSFEEAPS